MEPAFFSQVTMTADEYVAVNFRLWRRQPATRRNHWILLVALLCLAFSLLVNLRQANWQITSWSTPAFLAVGLLYALLRPWLVRRMLRQGYAKNTVLQEPVDYTLSADEIRGRSGLGQFSGKWTDIRRAVLVQPDWLLLYPNEAACYYLDLRQLQAPTLPSHLEELLAAHKSKVRRV